MSQVVLWQVMMMFKIPDVDSLEQIHEDANVGLAPNDEESATITFNTGVAQGSITSPQLFNIFINSLHQCSATHAHGYTGCRSARIRKETTSEIESVINSTT